MACYPVRLVANNIKVGSRVAVLMSAMTLESSPFPVAELSLYSAWSSGANSVWQMREYVFSWGMRSPAHLNKLFCNFFDLWIEFIACLERRCWNAESLSHYPTWQVERMLESNQLISVKLTANVTPLMHLFNIRFDVCPWRATARKNVFFFCFSLLANLLI